MNPDEFRLEEFRRILLRWWKGNARRFPWREGTTPYEIAIAEIMLRRTRADQVAPVYQRFLRDYPTLEAACRADPEEIRRRMRPLGLEWRAEGMVEFLRKAGEQFPGGLPTDPTLLLSLPGVGDYVSAAIACFAGGQAIALIDTNVVRVLGRLFGLDMRGEARRRREVRELAARAVDPDRPADYHYALLDFAALICIAGTPRCPLCPFNNGGRCAYYEEIRRGESSSGDSVPDPAAGQSGAGDEG